MKKNILVGALLLTTHFLHSQTAITSSGGIATGGGGTATYSIGQLVYTTNSYNSGSIAQGVQQAFEFQVFSNSDIPSTNLTLLTYPNPTSDNLVLKMSDTPQDELEYTLFDIQGKQIMTGQITNTKTTIETRDIANGVYSLKVTKNKLLLKAIKIIKK
ncbi:T9SS type A sorting domain-containing protein [Polaribacter sp. R77954]|uniref:T9SS type A sorting domain-containing protein n=1 Tax=Polaribacter sp. R77954 TaxID=3093870 RepID=UPI0037C72547